MQRRLHTHNALLKPLFEATATGPVPGGVPAATLARPGLGPGASVALAAGALLGASES